MHIKARGEAGVSAVAVLQIAKMQSRETMRREAIVLVRILGSGFRIVELVVGFAVGLVFPEGKVT